VRRISRGASGIIHDYSRQFYGRDGLRRAYRGRIAVVGKREGFIDQSYGKKPPASAGGFFRILNFRSAFLLKYFKMRIAE
jgi:hypothetical protein